MLARWESGELLREAWAPSALFPMRIPLKYPQGKVLSEDFTDAQFWVKTFTSAAEKAHLAMVQLG